MPIARKQVALVAGLGVAIMVAAALSWAVGHFFKVDPTPAFAGGLFASFAAIWTQGGRAQWNRLSGGWKTLALIAAAFALFISVALFSFCAGAMRDRSQPLMLASGITVAAGVLLILYLLFSRAMDALWSHFQRHR